MRIRASRLSESQRRIVWAHIQATDPEWADQLANDQIVSELRTDFSAEVFFPESVVNQALKENRRGRSRSRPNSNRAAPRSSHQSSAPRARVQGDST